MQAAPLSLSLASWVHNVYLERQGLEERYSVLATHLFEDNSEFIIWNFIDKMSLELYNNMITSEDGTEGVALITKEAEAVAFKDNRIIKASLN